MGSTADSDYPPQILFVCKSKSSTAVTVSKLYVIKSFPDSENPKWIAAFFLYSHLKFQKSLLGWNLSWTIRSAPYQRTYVPVVPTHFAESPCIRTCAYGLLHFVHHRARSENLIKVLVCY